MVIPSLLNNPLTIWSSVCAQNVTDIPARLARCSQTALTCAAHAVITREAMTTARPRSAWLAVPVPRVRLWTGRVTVWLPISASALTPMMPRTHWKERVKRLLKDAQNGRFDITVQLLHNCVKIPSKLNMYIWPFSKGLGWISRSS